MRETEKRFNELLQTIKFWEQSNAHITRAHNRISDDYSFLQTDYKTKSIKHCNEAQLHKPT